MKFDIKKVAHAILFFQQQGVQHLAKTKLMKLMFYADKYHLQTYMRPVQRILSSLLLLNRQTLIRR